MDKKTDRRSRQTKSYKRMRKPMFQTACLLTACACIVYGLSRGEAVIVLNKAINICLECIGLG